MIVWFILLVCAVLCFCFALLRYKKARIKAYKNFRNCSHFKYEDFDFSVEDDNLCYGSLIVGIIFSTFFTILSICCIVINARSTTKRVEYEQERQALVENYNNYVQKSNTDTIYMSKFAEIRDDIAKFNAKIINTKRKRENVFISWFYYDLGDIQTIEVNYLAQ